MGHPARWQAHCLRPDSSPRQKQLGHVKPGGTAVAQPSHGTGGVHGSDWTANPQWRARPDHVASTGTPTELKWPVIAQSQWSIAPGCQCGPAPVSHSDWIDLADGAPAASLQPPRGPSQVGWTRPCRIDLSVKPPAHADTAILQQAQRPPANRHKGQQGDRTRCAGAGLPPAAPAQQWQAARFRHLH